MGACGSTARRAPHGIHYERRAANHRSPEELLQRLEGLIGALRLLAAEAGARGVRPVMLWKSVTRDAARGNALRRARTLSNAGYQHNPPTTCDKSKSNWRQRVSRPSFLPARTGDDARAERSRVGKERDSPGGT